MCLIIQVRFTNRNMSIAQASTISQIRVIPRFYENSTPSNAKYIRYKQWFRFSKQHVKNHATFIKVRLDVY